MNWIKEMFESKGVNKQAEQTDAANEFSKKVNASVWLKSTMNLDEELLHKEAEAKLQSELKVRDELRKEAAYSAFQTDEEVVKQDLNRDVEILSDFTLASMIAEMRGHAKQDFMENSTTYFEQAKKDVKSNRKSVEKELLDGTGLSAQLDTFKAFSDYKKDETPKQATEKELYQPQLKDVNDDLSKGGKVDAYAETDEQHAKTMQGVGREADTRQDVTQQAGEIMKDAALVRDAETELKIGSVIELARSVMAKCGTILPMGSKWAVKQIEGFHYHITDDKNTFVISSFDTPKFDKIASQTEIENRATKSEVLKKVAEISSPWKVIVDPQTNQEVIARIEENSNTKTSDEDKDNLIK
jgi:hypothetical protein